MKKRYIAVILSGTIIAGSLFLFLLNNTKVKPINVKVSKTTVGDVSDYLSMTGTIKSDNSVSHFGPQGKVKKVHVSVGDFVKKGTLIAEFDVDDLQLSVSQAQIQYENALLSKELLLSNNKTLKDKRNKLSNEISSLNKKIDDLERLQDPSLLTSIADLKMQVKTLEQSKASITLIPDEQIKQADNAVTLAKKTLDNLKNNASKIKNTLVAEIDGVVTDLYLVENAYSTSSQPACVIQDIEDLKVSLAVGKYDSKFIEIGQKAYLNVNDKVIEGTVSFISPTATISQMNPTEPSLLVDVTLNDFDESLKVEFKEDVEILVREAKDVTRIPVEALRYLKDGNCVVYVVKDGIANEKVVKVGIESSDYVEILSGLTPGDKVILNPTTSIEDNSAVTVTSEVK